MEMVLFLVLAFVFGMMAGHVVFEWNYRMKNSSRSLLTMLVYEKVASKEMTPEDGADILSNAR